MVATIKSKARRNASIIKRVRPDSSTGTMSAAIEKSIHLPRALVNSENLTELPWGRRGCLWTRRAGLKNRAHIVHRACNPTRACRHGSTTSHADAFGGSRGNRQRRRRDNRVSQMLWAGQGHYCSDGTLGSPFGLMQSLTEAHRIAKTARPRGGERGLGKYLFARLGRVFQD